jgi:hypothetical protein
MVTVDDYDLLPKKWSMWYESLRAPGGAKETTHAETAYAGTGHQETA